MCVCVCVCVHCTSEACIPVLIYVPVTPNIFFIPYARLAKVL